MSSASTQDGKGEGTGLQTLRSVQGLCCLSHRLYGTSLLLLVGGSWTYLIERGRMTIGLGIAQAGCGTVLEKLDSFPSISHGL